MTMQETTAAPGCTRLHTSTPSTPSVTTPPPRQRRSHRKIFAGGIKNICSPAEFARLDYLARGAGAAVPGRPSRR